MGWIECEDQSLEKNLHIKYAENRINGEWFSIEPWNVLDELKNESISAYICIQSNAGAFLGCDNDAIPEYLGPWEWDETELEGFCPQCGWGGGVHYNNTLGIENCLRCGYPIF